MTQEPLVPLEVDLRGLPWMPLNLLRLFDSDLFALTSGDEFKAAVTLWGKSWYQLPAGSLPDDDRVLSYLSGTGKRWPKLKAMAMRGWTLCSDGRLYHKVVAEAAIKAWEERLRHMTKRERDTERLHEWREKQRQAGSLDKTGGLRDVPRGTETPDETKLKRVSVPLRNAPETAISRREETGKRQGQGQGSDREEKPVLVKEARKRALATKPDDVPQGVWDDFQTIRRAKRSPLTQTALDGISAQAGRAGRTLADALAVCCSRGWQGLDADWLTQGINGSGKSASSVLDEVRRINAELGHVSK